MTQQDLKDRLEHESILQAIQVVMSSPHGKTFIKYLFKSFNVGDLPYVGCRGEDLLELTSFLRAGNSIYKIVLEASPELTGKLLAEMEKDRADEIRKTFIDGSSNRN